MIYYFSLISKNFIHLITKGFYFTNSTYSFDYKFLRTIYGDGTDGWRFYTMDVGAYRAKYQIEINAYPAYRDNFNYSDIAIDDVAFVNCDAAKITFDESLDCDFDTNMCHYMNDPDAVIKWTRKANQTYSSTGPSYDHTTTKGYYALFSPLYSQTDGKTGLLLSSIQTTRKNQDYCFSFWYLMFGETVIKLAFHLILFNIQLVFCFMFIAITITKVNRLNFYLDEFDSASTTQNLAVFNRTLLWTRYLSQGRRWINHKANINSHKEWRVAFEALSGRTSMSDIALDDLAIVDGKCPVTKTCDFEPGNLFF